VLTSRLILGAAQQMGRDSTLMGGMTWLETDESDGVHLENWQPAHPGASDVAFLQYTSGSTGAPKGVQVTHANLLSNQAMIQQAFEHGPGTVVVGWLLYHDMGLIGNVLQPLFLGVPCVLMSPLAFLQRPARWLKAIARYRGTTGGPSFAYDLCVRKTTEAQRAMLDLQSWRVAFNWAERVRAETLERFAAAFFPSGFRREAF
jgi:acyl-CoA synthetase (AMP-forming)/AMP-acid ligase II